MDAQCARVLIIDHDDKRRRRAAQMLKSHRNGMKFDVKCLPSSDGAINLIQKERFDAVGFDCTQENAAEPDWINALRLLSPESAVIALRQDAAEQRRLQPPQVDDAVRTGTPDAWRHFASRIRQTIMRHKAEQALRRACRTFEAIIRNAPNAIVCVSPAGRILEFNARAEALWGLSRPEAIGRDFLDVCFSRQERFRINCEMQLLTAGESATDLRSFITLSDGRHAALSWDFSSVSTENGGLYIAIARELAFSAAANEDSAERIPFNPNFNDTVDLVLNSLCAIMDRIDRIHARTTPDVLERLKDAYEDQAQKQRRLPPKTAAAVERLVLGLITEHKQVS